LVPGDIRYTLNLDGFFHITQAAIQHMVARGNGHVVNITTSIVDRASSERPSALVALTKGGLAAVTRSLAMSSTESSTSSGRHSSPDRSCTSMAGSRRATDGGDRHRRPSAWLSLPHPGSGQLVGPAPPPLSPSP
jgi:hypothetical protein